MPEDKYQQWVATNEASQELRDNAEAIQRDYEYKLECDFLNE